MPVSSAVNTPGPLSSEFGTYKTVTARFWSWLSGTSSEKVVPSSLGRPVSQACFSLYISLALSLPLSLSLCLPLPLNPSLYLPASRADLVAVDEGADHLVVDGQKLYIYEYTAPCSYTYNLYIARNSYICNIARYW